jgi:hypothetical protein
MSILRRKPRKPRPIRGPMTLDLRPKDRSGSTSPFRVVKVESYTDYAPRVSIWIQNQSMGASVLLDEDEVGKLVTGLRDALEASKASAASRESQETSQDV